jgi:hypothetical protein
MEVPPSIQDRATRSRSGKVSWQWFIVIPHRSARPAGSRPHVGILNSKGVAVMRSPLKQDGVPAPSLRRRRDRRGRSPHAGPLAALAFDDFVTLLQETLALAILALLLLLDVRAFFIGHDDPPSETLRWYHHGPVTLWRLQACVTALRVRRHCPPLLPLLRMLGELLIAQAPVLP